MLRLKTNFPILLLFVSALIFLFSCRKKDQIDTNPSVKLTFSTDTIFFDTVFTTIGSVTQRLMVYNWNKSKINISSIRLSGGEQSSYRINVNGTPAMSITNVEIPGEDSIYLFVRVTVDPNNKNTPFIISDSILFNTNGNFQQVKLAAWGQNALFYKNTNLSGNITWDSLKAHVIYGSFRIDTGSTLTLMPGTKVFLHNKSSLSVSDEGSLLAYGTLEHPVQFSGDRLDPNYRDLPGQWEGIFLEKGSSGNYINYGLIKNGSQGIVVHTASDPGQPDLKLENTIIQNMTGDGLFTESSYIISTNCVIGNCGGSAISITGGGDYDFKQLTIGNYWSGSVRTSPSLYLSNFTYDSLGNKIPQDLNNAFFGNSIIYGMDSEEILLSSDNSKKFEYTFDHSLLKTTFSTADPLHFILCIVNQDPRFIDPQKYDFAIDSMSPVIDKGIPMEVPFDIKGNVRGETPDLGAFEYVKHR